MRHRHLSRRSRRVLAGLAALGLVLPLSGVLGGSAANADPTAGVEPAPGAVPDPAAWQRYVATGFTSPAGDLCTFELRSEVVFDAEYVRTPRTFADGSPRREEYVGPLVVRLTNQSSGASIVRDLSGRAVLTYRPNGSYDFAVAGPAAFGFRPPNDNRPRGYWLLNGYHVVRFTDTARTVVVHRGAEENLCRTLSKAHPR